MVTTTALILMRQPTVSTTDNHTPTTGHDMPIIFSSLFQEECLNFMDRNPNGNFLLEKDICTGRWTVLDAS